MVQVLAAAATNYRESETQSGSSWAGFLTHRPPKPAVETLLAKMHSSHSQVPHRCVTTLTLACNAPATPRLHFPEFLASYELAMLHLGACMLSHHEKGCFDHALLSDTCHHQTRCCSHSQVAVLLQLGRLPPFLSAQ